MITDDQKQKMLSKMCDEGLCIRELTNEEFLALLNALERMFFARVMNCCDATGRKDHEWSTLSDVFGRALKELGNKQGDTP